MARKDLPDSSDVDEAFDNPSDSDTPSQQETTPPRVSTPSQPRWLATLQSRCSTSHSRTASLSTPTTQSPLTKARAEVLSGFRSRAASSSSLQRPSGKSATQEKSAHSEPTRRKGKGKARDVEDELVRAIHILPEAWLGHSISINNSGEEILSIRYPAPTATARAALEYRGLSRYSTPQNPVRLDPTLNRQQTATHLANLFKDPYRLYRQYAGLSDDAPVPEDWIIQLHKERLHLKNIEGRLGTTVAEMLDLASHEGRRAATREIFLTVPFVIEGSNSTMTIRTDAVCGNKRKSRADDSSKDDGIATKRVKSSKGKEPATKPTPPATSTRTLRPRPCPKPRSRTASSSLQHTAMVVDSDSDSDFDLFSLSAAQYGSHTTPTSTLASGSAGSRPTAAPSPSPTVIDVDALEVDTPDFSFANATSIDGPGVAGPGPQSMLSRRDHITRELNRTFNFDNYTMEDEEDPFGGSYTL